MTEQNSPPAAASSKPDTPKGARAVCSIAVDAITVPSERLRKLRPEVVDWLVESITARSLLEPIIVRRRGAGYELIAGHHRFEAARNCSHQTIRAEVYDSLSDDEAELIQIDENLIRANLSDAERILHVARRKQLYEKLHPETKHGGDRRSAGARSSSQNENLKAFVADIAVKTGKGRSTVARDVTRAKKVAVLDDIAGTCLDKGDEIDALGKLPEGEQRKLATAARAGEKVSAKARKPRQKDADTAVRTTTAEVDADPAASTERRKRAYAADEPEREAMTAKDAALREFDGHVLRLAQIINRAEPERFARTSVDVDKLLQLSRFLAEVAGQQPQCADGHPAAVPITEEEAPRKTWAQEEDDAAAEVTDVS